MAVGLEILGQGTVTGTKAESRALGVGALVRLSGSGVIHRPMQFSHLIRGAVFLVQVLIECEFEDSAPVVGAASGGHAIKGALGAQQRSKRAVSILQSLKGVQHGLVAAGIQLE